MKNRFRKMISILLAVVMIAGVFTVVPLTASAKDTDEAAKPLLMGDVDGDDGVDVVDAALIQRYDVQMIGLTDQQLLTADLTVEGENPYVNFYDPGLLSEKMNAYFAP